MDPDQILHIRHISRRLFFFLFLLTWNSTGAKSSPKATSPTVVRFQQQQKNHDRYAKSWYYIGYYFLAIGHNLKISTFNCFC